MFKNLNKEQKHRLSHLLLSIYRRKVIIAILSTKSVDIDVLDHSLKSDSLFKYKQKGQRLAMIRFVLNRLKKILGINDISEIKKYI